MQALTASFFRKPGLSAVLVVAGPFLVPAAPAKGASLYIRVLDGRSGKPLANESVIVLVDPRAPGGPMIKASDALGRITIDVPAVSGVSATVKTHPTCRRAAKADRTKPPISFPKDEIVEQGVVVPNSCSRVNVAPTHPVSSRCSPARSTCGND